MMTVLCGACGAARSQAAGDGRGLGRGQLGRGLLCRGHVAAAAPVEPRSPICPCSAGCVRVYVGRGAREGRGPEGR